GVPARGQWAGLGLAVADDASDEQVGVVEGGTEGVRQRVAEFAAFVNRPRRLRGDMRWDAARKGELAEERAQAFLVLGDVGVKLGVGALEVGVGDEAGTAVAGAGDVDRGQVASLD